MKKKPMLINRNDLLDGHRRYCIVCRNQVATVGGRFVMHGKTATNGTFKACANSGKHPARKVE